MEQDFVAFYWNFAAASTERVIPYKPSYKELTGSVTAAILLQQIVFYDRQAGGEPFYKFKQPCDHALYRPGDSWCELLAFSRHEFDGAIKKIGKKVSGDDWEMGEGDPFVFYWVTMGRETYYTVNRLALGKAAFRLYEKLNFGFMKSENPALDQYAQRSKTLPENGGKGDKPSKKAKGKSEPLTYTIPAELKSPAFEAAFTEWITYRRTETRKPVTSRIAARVLKQLAPFGAAWAVARIDQAMVSGWTGLVFPDDDPKKASSKPTNRASRQPSKPTPQTGEGGLF